MHDKNTTGNQHNIQVTIKMQVTTKFKRGIHVFDTRIFIALKCLDKVGLIRLENTLELLKGINTYPVKIHCINKWIVYEQDIILVVILFIIISQTADSSFYYNKCTTCTTRS